MADQLCCLSSLLLARLLAVPSRLLRVQRFQNVSSVLLHFPSNHSGDSETSTRIYWLHLKGEASKDRREVVNVVYEAVARPSDHKTPDEQQVARSIQ